MTSRAHDVQLVKQEEMGVPGKGHKGAMQKWRETLGRGGKAGRT